MVFDTQQHRRQHRHQHDIISWIIQWTNHGFVWMCFVNNVHLGVTNFDVLEWIISCVSKWIPKAHAVWPGAIQHNNIRHGHVMDSLECLVFRTFDFDYCFMSSFVVCYFLYLFTSSCCLYMFITLRSINLNALLL